MFGEPVAGAYAKSLLKQLQYYVDNDLKVQGLSYSRKELAESELNSGLPFTKCSDFKAALSISNWRNSLNIIQGVKKELERLGVDHASIEKNYRIERKSTVNTIC